MFPTRLPSWLTWLIVIISLLPSLVHFGWTELDALSNAPAAATALEGGTFGPLATPAMRGGLAWSAVAIAFLGGLLAFLHFGLTRDGLTCVFGVALFCSGAIDVLLLVAAERSGEAPAYSGSLLRMGWTIGSFVDLTIKITGLLLLRSRGALGVPGRRGFTGPAAVLLLVTAGGLLHACVAASRVPAVLDAHSWTARLYGPLLIAMFAGTAGLLYWPLWRRQPAIFRHVLVVGTLPGGIAQLHMTLGSGQVIDDHFHIAQLLKIVVYLVPLAGLVLYFTNVVRFDYQASEEQRQLRRMVEHSRQQLQDQARKHREAESALSESQEHLKLAFQASKTGTWDWDVQRNRVMLDEYAYRVFGRPPATINTLAEFAAIVHPEDRHRVTAAIQEAVKNGTSYDIEYRTIDSTGDIRHLAARGLASYDLQGEPVRMSGICMDTSERKRAEAELRKRDDQLRLITDSLPVLIEYVDAGERTGFVNKTGELWFNKTRDQILGRTLRETTGELGYATLRRYINKALSGEAASFEAEVTFPSGSRYIEAAYVPDKGPGGEVKGFFALLSDASERKRSEKALAAYLADLEDAKQTTEDQARRLEFQSRELEAARDAALESTRLKSEFLATMSHEIRTPMNGIMGMTDLLVGTNLDAEQKEFAEAIRTSSEALLTIINDILDFSKIESGKLVFEEIDFDLLETVEGSVDLLADKAHDKGLEILSWVHTDVPTALRGDPGRLRQVLINFISNAVKFTEKGSVLVDVRAVNVEEGNTRLVFAVADTGIGIPEPVQARLFEPFLQADGSTTRKFGGTGLGLAISRSLVERMGGTVELVSELGKGSTFSFNARLPRLESAAGPVEKKPKIEVGRVLLLGASDRALPVLSDYLEHLGGRIETSPTTAAAKTKMLDAFRESDPFAVVLIDCGDDDEGALDFCHWCKELPRERSPVRLVLGPRSGRRVAESRAAVDGFLTKPLKLRQLTQVLGQILHPEQRQSGQPHQGPALPDQPRLGLRLLVADDNPVNRKVAVKMLQKLGHRSEVANNGVEVLQQLESATFDGILMDCQMPEMDGYEATRELRRREGGGSRIPVIALTANAMKGDRERCLEAGMDDYLSKPIRPDALALMLQKWANKEWPRPGQAPERSEPLGQ